MAGTADTTIGGRRSPDMDPRQSYSQAVKDRVETILNIDLTRPIDCFNSHVRAIVEAPRDLAGGGKLFSGRAENNDGELKAAIQRSQGEGGTRALYTWSGIDPLGRYSDDRIYLEVSEVNGELGEVRCTGSRYSGAPALLDLAVKEMTDEAAQWQDDLDY